MSKSTASLVGFSNTFADKAFSSSVNHPGTLFWLRDSFIIAIFNLNKGKERLKV